MYSLHTMTITSPPAIKNLRGEYYLNGHWVIDFSRATPVAGTMLYYQRGAEGDSVPETIIGRGPTTEPLVIEVRLYTLNSSHLKALTVLLKLNLSVHPSPLSWSARSPTRECSMSFISLMDAPERATTGVMDRGLPAAGSVDQVRVLHLNISNNCVC